MGVSVIIDGVIPPSEDYRRKLEAYRACERAGVNPPDALSAFFGWVHPGDPRLDGGREVSLKNAIRGNVDYAGGALIDLAKLPEGVTQIRVWLG